MRRNKGVEFEGFVWKLHLIPTKGVSKGWAFFFLIMPTSPSTSTFPPSQQVSNTEDWYSSRAHSSTSRLVDTWLVMRIMAPLMIWERKKEQKKNTSMEATHFQGEVSSSRGCWWLMMIHLSNQAPLYLPLSTITEITYNSNEDQQATLNKIQPHVSPYDWTFVMKPSQF